MIVVDEQLLDFFRAARVCEYCSAALRRAAHPHHIRARGMGGGGRLDVAINIIALGGPWDCNCHDLAHWGKVKRNALLEVVAKREGLPIALITEAMDVLRRL